MRRRSWWGWGYESEGLSDEETLALGETLGRRYGIDGTMRLPPPLSDITLPAPKLKAPDSLASIVSDTPAERISHSYGKAYRDVVRALSGKIEHPPDLVARPSEEADVVRLLDWCSDANVAAIAYGGGSSVVGGVEPVVGDGYAGTLSIDMGALASVREVDTISHSALIEAGVLGPALEDQLRPHGLTLRHFPQSFECSSLGGWIATRAGGHFATGPTHIDDLVESVRVVTPAGVLESRRLPGSGAGPSPDRMFIGSEGTLGIVTEAWMRLRPRPVWRAGGPASFAEFGSAVSAVRALSQSGLMPANCRLIDPAEALINGVGDGSAAILIVGFESADHPVDAWAARASEIVADHRGTVDENSWRSKVRGQGGTDDAAGTWRASFMRAPYVRDALVRLGVMCETFETAVTWDRFDELYRNVNAAVTGALSEVGAAAGMVTCRFTHVYPDGPAPYFTVIAPARPGSEVEQWDEVKAAAADAVIGSGGTITHHHAVGRDHRPWYDRQRPSLFAEALAAAKSRLDPSGIMNPGVLLSTSGN